MAITARYILVCDDVRREDNGKFIVLGMYTPDICVPQIPFTMPTLTFFMNLESDRAGNVGFRMRLQHQESGNVLAQGGGMIPVVNPQQPIIIPLRLAGVVLNAPGLYSFSLEIDNQRDPIAVPFNVQIGMPVAAAAPPGGMPRLM